MHCPFSDFQDAALLAHIGEYESVRRAAEACGISQPSATRRLRSMERRIDARLFESSSTGTRLTEAGEFWTNEARTILEGIESAQERYRQTFQETPYRLKLAAGQVVAENLLPKWLERWTTVDDGRSCYVEVGNFTVVQDWVRTGAVELGILELKGAVPPGLSAIPLLDDRLVLVSSPSHPLAQRSRPLCLDELARMPLVQREAESGAVLVLTQLLDEGGYPPSHPAIEVSSSTAVKSSVLQGLGPAVVPRISVAEELQSGKLHETSVEGLDLGVTVYAIYLKGRRLTSAARSFISCAKDRARDQLSSKKSAARC